MFLLKGILLILVLLTYQKAVAQSSKVIPGEYIVILKDSDHQKLPSALSSHQRITPEMLLVKRPLVETTKHALKSLSSLPNVLFAEPNEIYEAPEIFDEGTLGEQWHLHNTGQKIKVKDKTYYATKDIDINAPQAWELERGSKDIIVSVIDTGVRTQHPDLMENLWVNEAEKNGVPGRDDDGNGYVDDIHGYNFIEKRGRLIDDHGHGTSVSGIIGAVGDNGIGVKGVAWRVRLMNLRIMSANRGAKKSDQIAAIKYSVENGADVINCSWGAYYNYSAALEKTFTMARDAGVLITTSAGNGKRGVWIGLDNDKIPHYPSNYDLENVIAVSDIKANGQLSRSSNFGKTTVHLGAPATHIYTTGPKVDEPYRVVSGTSYAAPQVAGVAALLWSRYPDMSLSEVRDRILTTTRGLASLKGKTQTGGLLDAWGALTGVAGDSIKTPVWKTKNVRIESPHRYPANFSKIYRYQIPGAEKVRVYFERLDVEKKKDKVSLIDSKDEVISTYSGRYKGFWSKTLEGDEVKIHLKSNKRRQKWGFRATKIQYLTYE